MAPLRVSIVGLGMIGGSIGLALRKAEPELEVIGHDREPAVAREARKRGAVHRTEWNLISACEGADIIVLATPVTAIKEILSAVAPYLKEGCLVTDTANVKGQVMRWADEILPPTVNFVGGDPIILKEGTGIEKAEALLFQDALYCLVPSPRASPEAVQVATALVRLLGARPYFIDAAEHDGLMAAVEHLPLILSTVLMRITTNAPAWKELRKLAGEAFQSATHFASYDAPSIRETCLINSENLLRWIDACLHDLQRMRALIAQGDAQGLEEAFEKALQARIRWQRERGQEEGLGIIPPRQPGALERLLGWGRR